MTITPEIVDIKEGALIKAERLDPVAIFTGGGIDPILKEIERQVSGLEYDLETDKGRKEIASTAHKVSKSKVLLDGLGKNLVADWKGKAKAVDAVRKQTREFLDDLRDTVRKPLTEFEDIEKAKEAEKRRIVAFNIDHEDALAENSLFDREREMARKEAEIQRQEDERLAKEEAAENERKRIEREEWLKKESAKAAKRDAEVKAEAEKKAILKREADAKVETERIKREAKEAKEQADRDRIAAEEQAKIEAERVEREKVEAAEKAEKEKQEAVRLMKLRAAEEADKKERDRIAKEKADKIKADRDAANLNHRKRIDRETIEDIVEVLDISAAQAKIIVWSIAAGKVRNCTINYY